MVVETSVIPGRFSNLAYEQSINFQENVAKVESVDIIEFVTNPEFLGETLRSAQGVILKMCYGLWEKYPFTLEELEVLSTLKDEWGIELDLSDPDKFVEILILVIGRRTGKSRVISWITTYEIYRLICLGHPQAYYGIVHEQEITIMHCASSGKQAKDVFSYSKSNIRKVDFLRSYIDFEKDNETELRLYTPHDMLRNKEVEYRNSLKKRGESRESKLPGTIMIESVTANSASARGKSISTLIFSEFAHFQRAKLDESNQAREMIEASSKTDMSMYNALVPSVKDYGQDGRIIVESTPAEKGGMFYQLYCEAGGIEQDDPDIVLFNPNAVLLQLATWQGGSPYTRDSLNAEFARDPLWAAQEYGAHFTSPSATFLSPAKIESMIDKTLPILYERGHGREFIVSLDPASKSDTYSIAWGHYEFKNDRHNFHIDGLHGFMPEYTQSAIPGGPPTKLKIDPQVVLDWLLNDLIGHLGHENILEVVYDQWNSAHTISILESVGLNAFETTFTPKYKGAMYGNFIEKLNLGEIVCYGVESSDSYGWVKQLKLELKHLQKETRGGHVSYHHPTSGPVRTDDFADVAANVIHRLCLYNFPTNQSISQRKKAGLPPQTLSKKLIPRQGSALWGNMGPLTERISNNTGPGSTGRGRR